VIEITDKSAWILKANQIESQHVPIRLSDTKKKAITIFSIKPMKKAALMLEQAKSFRLTIRAIDFRSKNSLRELILTNFFSTQIDIYSSSDVRI